MVLLRGRRGEPPLEVTPPGVSVRSRVHEYGGGAYCLVPGEQVAWVDATDQRIALAPADGSGAPQYLTPVVADGARSHHGDLRADPAGPVGSLFAVRERHLADGVVTRDVVRCHPGADPEVVVAGRDFFAAPRPSPSGAWLAYVAWDHPDMSWDSSELWVQRTPGDSTLVAGGEGVSVGQPWWVDDTSLCFVSDAGGWWQPWRWWVGDDEPVRLCDVEAEFHGPDWALGQATMAAAGEGALVCRLRRDGTDRLGLVAGGEVTELAQPCLTIGAVVAHDAGVVCLGRSADRAATLWWAPLEAAGVGTFEAFGRLPAPLLALEHVARPEPFECRGAEGRAVHGLFFAPRLAGVEGPAGEAPPLLVFCHGGPTGSAEAGFDVTVQFFTSRGFSVAAVDYAGSTGYGRAFRDSLYGRWGEADSDDCAAAARELARRGLVDATRMAIRGGSAGGLTALNALVRSDCFASAVTWYGVTDLLGLEATTHDFESSYNHRLVGPLPDAEDLYRRRSPVNRVQDLHGAVALLYGLDDPVVPAAQARDMAAALRRRGVDCEEHAFEGEGHGFRRAETVERCLEIELAFYRRTLPADPPPP